MRAFRGVGGKPLFIQRGAGSKIYDADGKEYIDYVCSWGPLILGHAHPKVIAAVKSAAERGTSFGAPTELETELARLVTKAFPSIEMLRLVSSGTEACMSAIRVARAFTKRDKVIKFDGCYHGHADGLLVKAGSGGATLGVPDSAGVPASYASQTLVATYNDLASVEKLFGAHPGQVAAVIVEPVAANMGVVPPAKGFLQGLRETTKANGALLVFDEVICGFRLAYGGAQEVFGVKPDLTTLGKVIGGGLPVGAYGGRREIMELISPLGPVYQAGTLSGNPLAVTAGIETLRLLGEPGVYKSLEKKGAALEQGLKGALAKSDRRATIQRVGSILTMFFTDKAVTDFGSASKSDRESYSKFFHGMLDHGAYLPPSQFEAMFVSLAHSDADIAATVEAAKASLKTS